MGVISVFSLTTCPHCKAAKALLEARGLPYNECNISEQPLWRDVQFVSAGGYRSVPAIFFGNEFVGGRDRLESLDAEGALLPRARALQADDSPRACWVPVLPSAPLPSDAFLTVFPKNVQARWHAEGGPLDDLQGAVGAQVSSVLLMLETHRDMIVVASRGGAGRDIYKVGMGGAKGGGAGDTENLYCQIALEQGQTLFVDDPASTPGLEENEDYVKFGYNVYLGAPWVAGRLKGTIALMEREKGIVTAAHVPAVEAARDGLVRELQAAL